MPGLGDLLPALKQLALGANRKRIPCFWSDPSRQEAKKAFMFTAEADFQPFQLVHRWRYLP